MSQQVVITILGNDQAGIVEDLASRVSSAGGNWLESRMVRLGGEFAGVVRVSIQDEAKDSLIESLESIDGLKVSFSIGDKDSEVAGETTTFVVVGQDRTGIVKEISETVSSLAGNIEEMETGTVSAAMSAEAHFIARIVVRLNQNTTKEELQDKLEGLADDLMVDIEDTEEI